MSHTVIGVFDNHSEAQAAVAQLMSSGFTRDHIDISNQNATPATGTYGGTTNYSDNSVTDKVGNFFSNIFDSKDDADRYSQVARQGTMVTVHAQSAEEATRAAEVLDQFGAVDLDERGGRYGSTAGSMTDTATSGSLPVIEEELQVGKRVVETGGVRLRSRIIERPVEEHIRLREEHVHVSRNPVNRDATPADFNNFKEGTIEVTEHAEVPVVQKETRVVEEVRLAKDVEEREEVVRDTLRATDVEVENLGTTGTTGYGTAGTTGYDTTDTANLNTTDASGLGTGAVAAGAGLAGLGHADDTDSGYLNRSNKDWSASGGSLRRMSEIKNDYEVADDDEDVMDWDVVGRNGEKIGEVEDMIVDMQAMKVRYLEVELDDDLPGVQNDQRVLIPVGLADLDHSGKNVVVNNFDGSMVSSYPAYRGEPITRDYEHSVMSAFSPGYQALGTQDTGFYDHEYFRDRRSAGRNL